MDLIGQLARSPAADPSLGVQMEDQNRLAFETGKAAFELNYPFVPEAGDQLVARLDTASRAREGDKLQLWVDPRKAQLFNPDNGAHLTL